MRFKEITEDEYRKFWEKSDQRTFLSAPEIAHLRKDGRTFFFGAFEGKKMVAGALVRGTRRRFGKYDYYAPRGFLGDFENKDLVAFFVEKLKAELKKRNGCIFRMDPNVMLKIRDIDGNEVLDNKDNTAVVEHLKSLGFKRSKHIDDVSQVVWEFVLPVKGKTRDELFEDFGVHTKKRIKQALEFKIETKDLKKEELGDFFAILEDTAGRKKFGIRDREYFDKMYDEFSKRKEVQFVSAILNPKRAISKLEKELKKEEQIKPKNAQEKKSHVDRIKTLNAKMKKIREMFGEEDKDYTLASGMFMLVKPEILYFCGGNAGKYMKFDGQYVLQWEMIGRAINEGFERYNFYGIPENINEHPKNYGVYAYKRGFSGHVEEFIGEYEMPLSVAYYVNKGLAKLKKVVKK